MEIKQQSLDMEIKNLLCHICNCKKLPAGHCREKLQVRKYVKRLLMLSY